MKIGTHNGLFHADDCFAVAALRILHGNVEVVRTRDPELLATCDVVVDVGGEFAPERGRFDHHQREGAGVRENGVPFSSFGLVWKQFGDDIVGVVLQFLPSQGGKFRDQGAVAALVDQQLVQSVDASDCGFALQGKPTVEGARSLSVSAALSSLNPTWEERGRFDAAFGDAVALAEILLRRGVIGAAGLLDADAFVDAAAGRAADGVMILEQFVPWAHKVLPEGVLYVAFPSETGDWRVQCAPPTPGSFDKRKPLPAAWGGRNGSALATLTGVQDAVFCHAGLFICGAQSREGALELARQAVNN